MLGTVPDLTFISDKLVEGSSYIYRVSAVNKFGASEPTELSEPVIPKSQYSELSPSSTLNLSLRPV